MLKATRGKKLSAKHQAEKRSPAKPPALWPEGLTPFPFQLKCLPWALNQPATYLALDPGLGKTIVAAMLLNRLNQNGPTLCCFVSPPALTSNVHAEFKKWCLSKNPNLRVIPDTMLDDGILLATEFADLDNFPRYRRILIIDEAHRFKTETTKRSKALFALAMHFDQVVFLSGTPMPNSRPFELWPILSRFAPELFGTNKWVFVKRYCGAYYDKFGWHFDGFTNRKEFKTKLFKSFMLRMKQEEVLELPPLREGLLTVGESLPPIVSNVERKVLAHFSKEDLMAGKLAGMEGAAALHLATYLKMLGHYKIKFVLPYLEQILRDEKTPMIIFAHHKIAILALTEGLRKWRPIVITGETPMVDRKKLVDKFQNDPSRLVFIGNIQACGTGFTITKANRVFLVEQSWRDGDNVQAIKRAHRIGQKNSVLAQYVVLKDSFDRKRMESLLTKRQNAV